MPEDTPNGQQKSLEHLRHIRGADKAVKDIGTSDEHGHLLAILQSPENFSRGELIDSLVTNYDGSAFGDYQWSLKTGGWTTPEAPTIYGTFRKEYPELSQLSLDPGVITHLPTLMEMLKSGEASATDLTAAKDALKQKLGFQTMWRGTMLTDEELQLVSQTGLLSPLGKDTKTSDNPQEELEANGLSGYIHEAMEKHLHGENYFTPFLSVSAYPDVAIAVGKHFGQRGDGRKFHLLKLQIPTIDVISYQDHAIRMPYQLSSDFERNPDFSVKIGINGQEAKYKWDEKVESYVYWKINPDEIVEITQPDIQTSSWNGRQMIRK